MAALLRDLLDRGVDAVLLEDARLQRERERRKAGPAADADVDLVLTENCLGDSMITAKAIGVSSSLRGSVQRCYSK